MKPVSQPLTREQAQVAFTHITHGKFALDDVSFWEATQRDFAGKCWHWEDPNDEEEWGTLTVDRLKTFVQVQQYTEAGDRFRLLGTVTVRAINEQIRRNSDKENQQ